MEKYRPDIYRKNIYQIHYEDLQKEGIKCLLFDLDNTIIPYNKKQVSNELKDLFHQLKELKFKLIVMSNSSKKRLLRIKEQVKVPIIYRAMKPVKMNFKRVMAQYKYEENQMAIIGDQLLTDIKGGNKVGITTILVDPLIAKDGLFTRINRHRERKIFEKMGIHGLLFKGRYYE